MRYTLQQICTRRNLATLLTAIFFLSLIPPLLLSFYSFPSTDDFSFGALTHKEYIIYCAGEGTPLSVLKAALAEVLDTYRTWQGTYASTFLFSLQPAVFGSQYYFLTTWIILTVLIVGIMRLVSVLIRDCLGGSRADFWLVSSLILILCTQFAPSVRHLLYWYNGAVHYVVFFSIMLLDIAEHILFIRDGKWRRIILMGFFSFMLGGGNLVTALLSAELTVLVLVLTAWKKRERFLPLLIPAAILLAGLMVNALAPGNALRALSYGRDNSIVLSVYQAFGLAFQTVPTYLNTYVFLAMLLFVPIVYYLVRDVQFSFPVPGLVCLVAYLFLTSSYAPTMYGMEGLGGERIENIRYMLFLLLMVFCIAYMEGWLIHNLREEGLSEQVHAFIGKLRVKYGMVFVLSVLLCLFICVAFSKGKRNMMTTGALRSLLNGEAVCFLEECREREALLETDDQIVTLPPIKVQPSLLFSSDIVKDGPDTWINEDMARYYGKEKIMLGE